jgi:hypothetical protein
VSLPILVTVHERYWGHPVVMLFPHDSPGDSLFTFQQRINERLPSIDDLVLLQIAFIGY